ncbi:hypothetical protein ES703_84304 [subsurface metagenome]
MGNKPITKTNEIIMLREDPVIEECLKCGGELEHAWQPTRNYDDSNPVRICHSCDIAYIWHIYKDDLFESVVWVKS